eukprot:2973479-Amphidinium_carterae.2
MFARFLSTPSIPEVPEIAASARTATIDLQAATAKFRRSGQLNFSCQRPGTGNQPMPASGSTGACQSAGNRPGNGQSRCTQPPAHEDPPHKETFLTDPRLQQASLVASVPMPAR